MKATLKYMYPNNGVNKKFKKDDWKESDILEIANVLNCEYIQKLKMK